MTRVLLALCAALALGLAWQSYRASHLRSAYLDEKQDAEEARAELELAAEAAAVHRAHIARMQKEATRASDQSRALQTLEGRDAPLDDTLRDAAGILWP